jgi:hypothetical protein
MSKNVTVLTYLCLYLRHIDLFWDSVVEVIDDKDSGNMFELLLDDSTLPSKRRKNNKYDRIHWSTHIEELEAAQPYQFHYSYHLSKEEFNKLVDLFEILSLSMMPKVKN